MYSKIASITDGVEEVRDLTTEEQQEQDAHSAPNRVITSQIQILEDTVTNRRLRDAIAGTDGGWLKDIEAQIAALRGKLQ